MGVRLGQEIFSAKYPTAQIRDSSNRLWFVPIKYVIGQFFLAELNKQVFCFKMNNEMCTYREKLAKNFQVYLYDTSHYLPMSSDCKELELVLNKNALPKVNVTLSNLFKLLGRKEKPNQPFTPHTIQDIIKEISEHHEAKLSKMIPEERNEFEQNMNTIITYLNNLGVDRIVTPVRGVSDFIEEDLKATDPKFLGTIATTLQHVDYENKKMTNTPTSPAVAWMKWALIFLIVGMVAFVGYYAYSNGYFDSITNLGSSFEGVSLIPQVPTVTTGGYSDAELQAQYTPEELKAAIDRGERDYNKLSPTMQKLVDGIELPTATP